MDPRSGLIAIAHNTPIFEATFEGDAKKYKIAITDHDTIVMETAVGFLASINIWCPGSPIAPALNPTGLKKGVLTDASQVEQMKEMAKYIFDLAAAGVVGFMLQEVPKPGSRAFKVLDEELKALCKQYNKKTSDPIMLELENWSATKNTQSGTCSLVNTNKLDVKAVSPSIQHNEMIGRFGCYLIQDKRNKNIKFNIYNIHGDWNDQNIVADFVVNCVKQGAMTCGDLNIPDGSDAAKKLTKSIADSKHNYITKGRGNTLDCFYDPYIPGHTQQNLYLPVTPTSSLPVLKSINQRSNPVLSDFTFMTTEDAQQFSQLLLSKGVCGRDGKSLAVQADGKTVIVHESNFNIAKQCYALPSSRAHATFYQPAQKIEPSLPALKSVTQRQNPALSDFTFITTEDAQRFSQLLLAKGVCGRDGKSLAVQADGKTVIVHQSNLNIAKQCSCFPSSTPSSTYK